MTHPVLVIEDEPTLAKNICAYLQRHSFDVHVAGSGETGLDQIAALKPGAIVLDFNLPGINGLEVLARIRSRDRATKIVMMTGHGSEQIAVDAMKAGANDYLPKPIVLARLRSILENALEEFAGVGGGSIDVTKSNDGTLDRIIGESQPVRQMKECVRRIVESDRMLNDSESPAVLITGETGTGKELVARALHFEGRRREGPFVEVNCSGIPANLLESELFGFERGAFTDAKENKLGLIEAAEGGTIFLDEIGELEPSAQAKVLKLLEDKIVRRLGSLRERRVNVRIVAATNRDLESMIADGKFRADLFFRLRIIHLSLPRLHERGDDVILLAQHFLALHRARYGKHDLRFSDDAIGALKSHAWPGNVRELRNVIEQSVIMAPGNIVTGPDLAFSQGFPQQATVYCESPRNAAGRMNLYGVERDMLVTALERCSWNVSQAARLLGVSRDTLRYRIEKYQLNLPT